MTDPRRKLKATHSRKLKFLVVDPRNAPPGPGLDPRVREAVPAAEKKRLPRLHGNERGDTYFFVPRPHPKRGHVAIVRDGAWVTFDAPCALDALAALSPDGTELAVAHDEDERLRVDVFDVASGSQRSVLDVDTKLLLRFQRRPTNVVWTPEGWVVLASGALILTGDDPGAPKDLVELEGAYGLRSALQGRLLLTEGKGSSTQLLTVRDGTFGLLRKGSFKLPKYVYEDGEGRVFLDLLDSVQEVVGVADAVGWSPEDLPPVREPQPEGELAFASRTARTVVGRRSAPVPEFFGVEVLADGSVFAFRAADDGYHPVVGDQTLPSPPAATGPLGPSYALSADRTSLVYLDNGGQLWSWTTEAREPRAVAHVEDRVRYLAHAGDAVLLSLGKKVLEVDLESGKARTAKGIGGRVDDVCAIGDAVVACVASGTSGPPKSKVFRRDGAAWKLIGELPLGVRQGWSHEGRHFVTCWHGRGAFEIVL